MVLVSVLVPSYNHEKYINETIDSILNQTFRDLELIIVDDCSKDNSKEIIKTYQKKDKRVRVFFHEKNMGMAKTFNHCLTEAKGKYVAFIGSDDVWVESKLEKQLKILNSNDSLVVWSEAEIINSKSLPMGKTFTQLYPSPNNKKSGNIFEELLCGNFICGQSIIFKREFVKEIKVSGQLKYLNDFKLYLDLAEKHPFFFMKEPLAKYRLHGKNTMGSDKKNWAKDWTVINGHLLHRYGSRISKRTRANLLFQTGKAYAYLDEDSKARIFFHHAIKTTPLSYAHLLRLTYFLTNGKGRIGKFLVDSFKITDFSLIRLRKKLRV